MPAILPPVAKSKVGNWQLILSGASDFRGTVHVNSLKVDLSGASDVNIRGSATNLNVDASGASHFNGFDFATDNCLAEGSGASDIKIKVNKVINAESIRCI